MNVEDKSQYEEFLRYLYRSQLYPRLERYIQAAKPYPDPLYEAVNASRVAHRIRSLETALGDDQYVAARSVPLISDVVSEVDRLVHVHNQVTVNTGVADVIHDHYDEIIDGMEVEHLEPDIPLLESTGSPDPHGEIVYMVHMAKSRRQEISVRGQEERFSEQLQRIELALDKQSEQLRQLSDKPAPGNEPPKLKPLSDLSG